MSFRKILLITTLALFQFASRAQSVSGTANDSSQLISFYGTLDTYYHRSFGTLEQAPRTSFANLPGFSLGMINIVMEYAEKRGGFTADFVFGPRGSDALFNASQYKNISGGSSSHLINQMFVYYKVSERLRLNIGQFNTFFGYETISPSKNAQYSTSYLFSYGPFNHTGVWADVRIGGGCAAKLAVMNPADYTEFNPFNSYTIGGQLSIKNENSVANINVSWGDPDGDLHAADTIGTCSLGNALQVDLAASLIIGEKYNLGISGGLRSVASSRKIAANDNEVLAKSGYYGGVLYQNVALSSISSLGLRTEYFYEYNEGVNAIGSYSGSGKAGVAAITLSGDIHHSAFRFTPEIRYDNTSTNSFRHTSGDRMIRDMWSINIAVVYTFPVISYKIK